MAHLKAATNNLARLKLQCIQLLRRVVLVSLLPQNQPPQVLKKDTKFSVALSLATATALHLQDALPTVRAIIVNETQLKQFKADAANGGEKMFLKDSGRSGILTGDDATLRVASDSAYSLVATFDHLKLGKIDRGADRRGAALEEKFCLIFHTEFMCAAADERLKLTAWTATLPVVVVVHDLQKCQAEGPILWDNAFFEPNRSGFEVRQRVAWPDLELHLQSKFRNMTKLNDRHRDLNTDQLAYLAAKLFSALPADHSVSDSVTGQKLVTYEMLFKTNLPNRTYTFWEWFWQAAKTIKEDMREEWIDGLIHGFIDKTDVENLLENCGVMGTFLIRFVDSQPGRVCIHHLVRRSTNYATVYDMFIAYLYRRLATTTASTCATPNRTRARN